MTTTETILYRFHLPNGPREIRLTFDQDSFTLLPQGEAPPPDWARLEENICPHCPLTATDHPYCPFAAAFAPYVQQFDSFYSYDEAVVEAVTKNRTVVGKMALQRGMASVIGLIGATSGCPHLLFYRPMARFHLPFSRDDETLYRLFSMYLLRCHLGGQTIPPDQQAMQELQQLSHAATEVNRTMAIRLRVAFTKDVAVNAIIVLDSFAQAVPFVIEEKLEELRAMFRPSFF